jgi:rubrerythrin
MPLLKEQIREAIRREKRVYDLYRLASASTRDESRRAFTQRLADEAVHHLALLERACRRHSASLSTFFQHYVPDVKFAPSAEEQIDSALQAAVESKQELLELYTSITDASADPGWGEMFRELVEASRDHLEFVRTHLASMP